MNQRSLTPLLLLVLISGAFAQDLHLVSPTSTAHGSLLPATMVQRAEVAASRYAQYAPVPRLAMYDMAAPHDASEYAATNGFGVVLIVVYTQLKAEIPLQRVVLRTDKDSTELKLLASTTSEVDDASIIRRVFGPHQWEGLYLYPLYSQSAGSELVADYQINRSGFVLAKFNTQGWPLTSGSTRATLRPGEPDEAAVLNLIKREYPGFVLLAPTPNHSIENVR